MLSDVSRDHLERELALLFQVVVAGNAVLLDELELWRLG
jgi:hypothetical protein